MKKKIFSIVGVAAFAGAVAFNVNIGMTNGAKMDLALANIEALAGCESTPTQGKGKSVTLKCTNTSGESYELSACDFDDAYITSCIGRKAND